MVRLYSGLYKQYLVLYFHEHVHIRCNGLRMQTQTALELNSLSSSFGGGPCCAAALPLYARGEYLRAHFKTKS